MKSLIFESKLSTITTFVIKCQMINLHNSKIIETPSEMICVRQFSVVDGGIFVYIYV